MTENSSNQPPPRNNAQAIRAPDPTAQAVFNNHLIVKEIFAYIPARAIRRFRTVNKIFNVTASDILNLRQSPVKVFDNQGSVNSFLDTMDNRLEDKISYSAFTFQLGSIGLEVIRRFGEAMSNQARKLYIDLYTNALVNCKPKAVLLLSFLSNLSELLMELNEDSEATFLTSDDLRALPPQFPRLKFLKFRNWYGPVRNENLQNLPIDLTIRTFWTEIPKRSSRLDHIHIVRTGNDYYFSSSQRQLPMMLAQVNPPPALSLDLTIMLFENGVTLHRNHFVLLRDLNGMGYNRLRTLSIRLEFPSPNVTEEFNRFLALQAGTLEKLTLVARATGDPTMHGTLTFPILPMLTFMHASLDQWPLTHVQPNPLTVAQFPNLTHQTMKIVYTHGRTSNVEILGRT